jgi:iron complex outermembrane receptor protein
MLHTNWRTLALALSGGMLTLSASAVLAQNAATTGTAASGTPAASQGGIEEIIVTARKRNESIQTTPVAVTAISTSQLEAAAVANIGALQGAAPNVLITHQSTGSAAANVSIRGIAFADIEKSFDPAVGINVDGVYIGTSTGQYLDFFDIASIEVLRGPQGTLFGRNTIAGVINIQRTRPTGEWGGKFDASWAHFGEVGLRAVVNAPIVQDKLAIKLFAFHDEGDGWNHDFYQDKDRGSWENENYGAALQWTPTDSFNALLTLEKQSQQYDPVVGSISQTGDVFCAFAPPVECNRNNTDDLYEIFAQNPTDGDYDSPAATLQMDWDTGPVKLTSITSYRDMEERTLMDVDALSADLYVFDRRQDYDQFSQEFRAAGDLGDRLDYVAGLYYFESEYRLVQYTKVFGILGAPFALTQDTTGKSASYAGYLDVNWEIFDKWRVSVGGRYTHDKKESINPLLAPGGLTAEKSWDKFTPKLGIDFRPNDDLMVYASYQRGYRSGGFNGRGQTPVSATTPYDPETVDAYEIGLKSEFLDSRVALNVAAFYTDYQDMQQSTTITLAGGVGNETIVTNASTADIQGIEADITFQPTDNLTFRSAIGYTDAEFGDFITSQPVGTIDVDGDGVPDTVVRDFDLSNVDLIYAPEVTFALSGEYTVPLQWGAGAELRLNASYRYLSEYDQQIAADPATPIPLTGIVDVERNDPRLRSDTQSLVDASISLEWSLQGNDSKARLTLFGRNLADDRGTQTAFTVAAFPTLWAFAHSREPRTYGVQVGFEF